MKKTILAASIVFIGLISCNQNQGEGEKNQEDALSTELVNNPSSAEGEEGAEKMPTMEFTQKAIDFGEISQGEKVKQRFRFKNTGKSDLIISDAKGSCGCTVPSWPRQPIRPGQEGEVEVVFDSNGKSGRQHKTVTLVANTVPNKTVIALKGDVIAPD